MARSSRLAKAEEVVRYRPKSTIKVYSDKMPEVKNLKVGEECTLIVKAKVKSIYTGDSMYLSDYDDEDGGPGSKTVCATLQVESVKEK